MIHQILEENGDDEVDCGENDNADVENAATHAVDAEAGLGEDGGVLGRVPDEVGHRVLPRRCRAVEDEGHQEEAGGGEAHHEGPPQDRHHCKRRL